ncbi:MAG TPA: hypothetical protein VIN38_11515 [Thiobacillus sp.]
MKIGRFKSICCTLVLISLSSMSAAQSGSTVSGEQGTDMLVDAVVMRPLGLAALLAGTVLTVVTLPFTIPSGSVESSAREWIVKPAEYTFKRPLGDFSDAGP